MADLPCGMALLLPRGILRVECSCPGPTDEATQTEGAAPGRDRARRSTDRPDLECSLVNVFEAIRTTRAMRRLDPHRFVSDGALHTILEAATKGASGGNSQRARWLVVTDAELKRQVGEVYRRCAEDILRG